MCYSFISAYTNLPNSSCHFLKHKSVFLQKYIIYFGQRSQLKSKFFRFSSARVKIHQILHVMSFFIAMTHNSSVNFKLIHFLLWTKESHQSPSFDTSTCSGENLPNSCHFSNHKSAFFQILHHSSVLGKITPLYFFSSNIIYFGCKEPIKTQIF